MRLKNYLLRSHSYSQGLLARSLSVPLQTDLSATSSETSLRHFRPWECSGGGGVLRARCSPPAIIPGTIKVLIPETEKIPLRGLHSRGVKVTFKGVTAN